MTKIKITGPIPLDASVDKMLATKIDPASRLELTEIKETLEVVFKQEPRPSLVSALFSYIMPNLQTPEVLRNGNQCALLEGLISDFGGQDRKDSISRFGVAVIKSELQRLYILRQNKNSLVAG